MLLYDERSCSVLKNILVLFSFFFFFVNGHAIKVEESRMNCTTTLVAYRHRFFIVPYLSYGVCVLVWYNKLCKFIKQKWVHFIKRDRKESPFEYIQQLTLDRLWSKRYMLFNYGRSKTRTKMQWKTKMCYFIEVQCEL